MKIYLIEKQPVAESITSRRDDIEVYDGCLDESVEMIAEDIKNRFAKSDDVLLIDVHLSIGGVPLSENAGIKLLKMLRLQRVDNHVVLYSWLSREMLMDDLSNAIRLSVRDYAVSHGLSYYDIRHHTGCLRNLIIRNTDTGQWMVVVIFATLEEGWQGLMEHLRDTFPQITSLQYIVNEKLNDSYSDLPATCFSGSDHIEEVMGDLRFAIRPQTFYQTNSAQAQRLYSFVDEYAELTPDDVVYDLYTGTGTIALFLARSCRQVVGIEYVEDSILAARENALRNQIGNAEFHAGDMAKVLTPDFVSAHGTPDVVITDPPRAGMHEKVVQQLLAMRPRRIVYVSCNPATQARDLELLAPLYRVGRIQPVDMFPHTQHVENIAELILS